MLEFDARIIVMLDRCFRCHVRVRIISTAAVAAATVPYHCLCLSHYLSTGMKSLSISKETYIRINSAGTVQYSRVLCEEIYQRITIQIYKPYSPRDRNHIHSTHNQTLTLSTIIIIAMILSINNNLSMYLSIYLSIYCII